MKADKALPLIALLAVAFIGVKALTAPDVAPSAAILLANDTSFDRILEKDPPLKLVEFGAPWCPPCRRLQPTLNKLADWQTNTLAVVQIDFDESPALAEEHKVTAIPALFLYRGSEVITSTSARSYADLQALVNKHTPNGKTP